MQLNPIILDANGFIHRVAHVTNGDAALGRIILRNTLKKFIQPFGGLIHTPLYAVFDGPTSGDERRALYAPYKAKRPESEPVMNTLRAVAPELMAEIGFRVVRSTCGFEADDVIYVLAQRAAVDHEPPNYSYVVIASDDKDMLCLLANPRIRVFKNGEVLNGRHTLEKYGVEARFMADYLALVGDASDNIPGAVGIGKMRAAALITRYGHIASALTAYQLGEQIEGFHKAFLANSRMIERVRLSLELVRLRNEATWEAVR